MTSRSGSSPAPASATRASMLDAPSATAAGPHAGGRGSDCFAHAVRAVDASASTRATSASLSLRASTRSAPRRSPTGCRALRDGSDDRQVPRGGRRLRECRSARSSDAPGARVAHPGRAGAGRRRRVHERPAHARPAPTTTRAKVVGSAIFGDGCAAALVDAGDAHRARRSSPPPSSRYRARWASCTWSCQRRQLPAPRDRELPDRRRRGHLGASSTGFLRAARTDALSPSTTGQFTRAAGGSSSACRPALELREQQIAVSPAVLANHGNVGTPSIFYVLARAIKRRQPAAGRPRSDAVTIGPGVTSG